MVAHPAGRCADSRRPKSALRFRRPYPLGSMARPKYQDPLYRQARRAWATRVARGEVTCHMCGQLIAGAFHLDHVRESPGVLHLPTPSVI